MLVSFVHAPGVPARGPARRDDLKRRRTSEGVYEGNIVAFLRDVPNQRGRRRRFPLAHADLDSLRDTNTTSRPSKCSKAAKLRL